MNTQLKSLKEKLSLKKYVTLACLRDRLADTYLPADRNAFLDRIVKVKKEIAALETEIAIRENK